MKNQLLIAIILAIAAPVKAQIGITATTAQNQTIEWQVMTENFIVHRHADFLRYGTSGTIDYVFKLKNEAIRFRPAIYMMFSNSIYYPHHFKIGVVGLQGNLEFALWRAVDRQGKAVPFRPFLQLSPGFAQVNLGYDGPAGELSEIQEILKSKRFVPNFGVNIFLEFKLSSLLVIAPTAGFRYFPGLVWQDFTRTLSKGNFIGTYDRTNLRQFNLGMRIGLTFYKK